MKDKNADIFVGVKKEIFKSDNFFLLDDSFPVDNQFIKSSEPSKRLNDYDFNLLKEDAYKDVSDDLFKLEYKISKTEEDIKKINAQLQSALEINDYNLIEDLSARKKILEEDFEALVAIYNDKSFSARISDKILNIFGANFKNEFKKFRSNFSNLSENILSKMPKQFSSIVELRKSLTKLENLNKSVDELISLNIPYGENINKYEQLSKYIIKANSIQADISRYIKER